MIARSPSTMELASDELHCVTRAGMTKLATAAVAGGVKPGTLERLMRIAGDGPEGTEYLYRLAGSHLPRVPGATVAAIIQFAERQGLDEERLRTLAEAMRARPPHHGVYGQELNREQVKMMERLMCEAGFQPEHVGNHIKELAQLPDA